MAVRAPHLYSSLRSFTLGAFVMLGRDLEDGAELPIAFEEHGGGGGGPALYEYRPLVRPFIEEREVRLRALPDAELALDELHREPAAAIFSRAHAGPRPDEELALFRTILLGLVTSMGDACGGFDWDDRAFDRSYAELERSLFGEKRAYAAIVPLVGLTTGHERELAEGLRVRHAVTGELARHWPEAQRLLPPDFGREVDRLCVIELERALEASEEPPDAPAELADAVSAIRLATAGPVAAGPVLFERLDGRPSASTRSVATSRASCSTVSRSPTRTRHSPRRSTVGSCRSSSTSRSGRSSCARRCGHYSARRRRCGPPSCSSCRAVPAPSCTRSCATSPTAPRRARKRRMLYVALWSLRCARATVTRWRPGSTRSCSASPRPCSLERPASPRLYTRAIARRILLTGATGYVGGRLLRLLEERGELVRCLSRRPEYLRPRVAAGTEVVQGDVLRPETVIPALDDVDAAYYLVHSMGSRRSWDDADRRAAVEFGEAARTAGVSRIVYLGGLGSGDLSTSPRGRRSGGSCARPVFPRSSCERRSSSAPAVRRSRWCALSSTACP
jgi:hypothetical protein